MAYTEGPGWGAYVQSDPLEPPPKGNGPPNGPR